MELKDIKILVIPDVHARDFWREPVKEVLENTDAKIVFLGDYLDPYPHEFEHGFDFKGKAIDVFKEIIDLKKSNPDRITLLIGNHDCGYRFDLDICDCRTDYHRFETISTLFHENKDLFQLADEAYVGDKHIIFSHAGIHKGYVERAFLSEYENINESNVVAYFNNAYDTEEPHIINSLGMYDNYRGWGGYEYGSLVWADANSWKDYDGYCYQVFGHTQLLHGCGGYITKDFALIDSSEAFAINELGEIKPFSKKKD